MSPTRFRCANSLNQGGRVATCRGERAEAPQHRPVTIASGSCSVTVITGDSESLNPGSIPGRTLRAGASHVVFLGGLGLHKIDFLHRAAVNARVRAVLGAQKTKNTRHARRDSNPQPPDSKSDALSIAPRAQHQSVF